MYVVFNLQVQCVNDDPGYHCECVSAYYTQVEAAKCIGMYTLSFFEAVKIIHDTILDIQVLINRKHLGILNLVYHWVTVGQHCALGLCFTL